MKKLFLTFTLLSLIIIITHRDGYPGPKKTKSNSVTILTKKDILKLGTSSIRDVLGSIPGVSVNISSVNLRGSTKVKVLLNGRPLNDPTSPHGGIKLDQVVVSDIKKIEVIMGGGSVAYGDNASGGVILITSDSKKGLTGFVKADMGSYGVRKIRGNATAVMGDLSLNTTASLLSKDGYVDNDDGKKFSGGMKSDYKFNNKSSLGLAFDYFKEKGGICGKESRPTPHSRKDYQLFISGLNLRLPWLKLQSFVNKGSNNNTDVSKNKDTTVKVLKTGHKLFSSLPINNFLNLNMGGGFEYKEGEGKGYYGATDYSFAKTDEKAFYGFLSDRVELKDLFLTLNVGGRFIYYSDYRNVANPEIKISFRKNTFGIKGSFSMTNNTPTFLQRYQATSVRSPNPNLEMERAINYSTSIFFSPIKPLTMTVSTFHNIITDRITVVDNAGANGKDSFGNIGEVTYTGTDSFIKLAPWKFFAIKGTYLYLKSKDKATGKLMARHAKHHITSQVEVKPMENMMVLLEADYKSKIYLNSANTEIAKGRILWDMSMNYKIGQFTMKFEVKNIMNTDYLLSIGLKGYPRRYNASVKFNF